MISAFLIIIGRSANGLRWSHQLSLLPPSARPTGSLPGGLRLGSNSLIRRVLRPIITVTSSFFPALREVVEGATVVPPLAGRARWRVLKGSSNRIEGRLGL